jgi:hypothetical protein
MSRTLGLAAVAAFGLLVFVAHVQPFEAGVVVLVGWIIARAVARTDMRQQL